MSAIEMAWPSTLLRDTARHFRERATCWFMAVLSVAAGLALYNNQGAFTTDDHYNSMMRVADVHQWVAAFTLIGTVRLVALVVNGSLPSVTWTPYARAVSSVLSAALWLQVALCAILDHDRRLSEIVYPALVLLEFYNTATAMQDVAKRPI